MKFYQIAAAVLIFKLFEPCLMVAASSDVGSIPIVYALLGVVLWLIASLFVWFFLAALDRSLASIGSRNDG